MNVTTSNRLDLASQFAEWWNSRGHLTPLSLVEVHLLDVFALWIATHHEDSIDES